MNADDNILSRLAAPLISVVALLKKTPVSIGVLAVCFAVGTASLWVQFHDRFANDPRFQLTAEKIEITPPPDWIHTDVKAEVFRDGSLATLSLRDPKLVKEVADAFAVHSWIAEVKKVHKSPDRVRVEMTYRRPVAMVEVYSNGERGLIPVAADGTILPTADFSPNEARNYLRVSVPNIKPYGVVGTRWDDERVCDGAEVAAAWTHQWRKIALYRIVALTPSNERVVYELRTKKGSQVIWGSPIGDELPGEAGAKRKIATLLRFVDEKGSLDEITPSHKLDLQEGSIKKVESRTARLTK